MNKLSYEVVTKDSTQMKHFVGPTTPQIEVLYDLLNDVCPLDSRTILEVKVFTYFLFICM